MVTRDVVMHYLQKNRMNISDLASEIKSPRSNVSNIINGKRFTMKVAIKMARRLGINEEYFVNLLGHTTKASQLKSRAVKYFDKILKQSH